MSVLRALSQLKTLAHLVRGRGRVRVRVGVVVGVRVGVGVKVRVEDVGAHAYAQVDVGDERGRAALLDVHRPLEGALPLGEVLLRGRGRVRV